ncbi:MAG: tol-pal system-associated acyl-CoA thioesterase [Pseudomonadales bacterium]|nr:tol-pal system-associated acyl-CoA thioesterase [Pseudomonadales bacterium]
MSQFELSTRVFIEDTDAGGIVYYVNYLKFMERARTEWLRELGFNFTALHALNSIFVVKHADVNYQAPAKMDDLLKVTASVVKMARTYIVFRQTVERDDTVLCEATIKVGCIDKESMRPTQIDSDLKAAFESRVTKK